MNINRIYHNLSRSDENFRARSKWSKFIKINCYGWVGIGWMLPRRTPKKGFPRFPFLCLPVLFDNKAREVFRCSPPPSRSHSCILNKLDVTPMLNERTSDYRRVELEFSFRELCVQAPVKIFIHEFTLSHFIFSRLSCSNNTPII